MIKNRTYVQCTLNPYMGHATIFTVYIHNNSMTPSTVNCSRSNFNHYTVVVSQACDCTIIFLYHKLIVYSFLCDYVCILK